MSNVKVAWGIDIGNRALKAVQLTREADRLHISDLEVIEHEQILSSAGDNRESMIQSALANFIQRHPTLKFPVAIGVSGQSSFARFIKLPPVEPKKIPEIVRFEAIQQIPFPLDEVEWAYQLFQAPDSPDVEVGIFAMRKELVNRHIKFFTDVGMNVQVVQMSPLAVYNAVNYDKRFDGTTMVIDMGAENTDLIIADGHSVWLRTIPVGGNNFTETLAKSFKLSFPKAEELKRNAATSKYARQIFQAMRPVFADLVAEIQRSIGFYASVNRDARIKRIIALGGTFRLPTLQKYLNQNLQIDIERLDAFTAAVPEDARMAAVLHENLMSMAGAYGLALQAMGQGAIVSSLLPEPIRKAQIWKDKTKWFAAAAALFVIGTVTSASNWAYQDSQWQAALAQRDDANTVRSKIDECDKKWSSLQSQGTLARQRVQNYASMPKYEDLWARLLADVYAATPQVPADELKATPRAQRKQVVLQDVTSRYEPEMSSTLDCSDEAFRRLATGGGGAEDFGAGRSSQVYTPGPGVHAAARQRRGFLLTIHCTSPNAHNPGFVEERFVNNLLKVTAAKSLGLEKPKPYYIARATIVSAQQINQDQVRVAASNDFRQKAAQAAGQPGAQPAPPGAAQAAPAEEDPLADPLMPGESIINDWEFTILVAVVMDPQIETPKEAHTTDR